MILVDTNIIIDFWNNPTAASAKIFSENDIALCGVIKIELLRGSKSANDFAQIETTLENFYYLNFVENDWVTLAKQLYCALLSIQKNNLFKVYLSNHISIRLFRPEALIHIIGNFIIKSLM